MTLKIGRLFCAFICILFASLSFAGCNGNESPDSTEAPGVTESAVPTQSPAPSMIDASLVFDEAQRERLLWLARGFQRFGEYDSEEVYLGDLDRIVYCMYTDVLVESSVGGYGLLSVKDADAMITETFGLSNIATTLRTHFSSTEEQEFFFLDDTYYIGLSNNEGYVYSFVNAAETEMGYLARINVQRDGEDVMNILFTLAKAQNPLGFIVSKCVLELWK